MKAFIFLFTFFLFADCNQQDKPVNNTITKEIKSKIKTTLDSSNYITFNYDSTLYWVFPIDSKITTLNNLEILEIENQLNACIIKINSEQEMEYKLMSLKFPKYKLEIKSVVELKNYKLQLLPIINDNGEKEVWVNCFCSDAEDYWRKEIVMVMDGGNCFFNVKINLTYKYFYDLRVNGVA